MTYLFYNNNNNNMIINIDDCVDDRSRGITIPVLIIMLYEFEGRLVGYVSDWVEVEKEKNPRIRSFVTTTSVSKIHTRKTASACRREYAHNNNNNNNNV